MQCLKRLCVLRRTRNPSFWGRKHDQNAKIVCKAGLLPNNIISSSHNLIDLILRNAFLY